MSDAALGGGTGCDSLAGDVCGKPKKACIDVRTSGERPTLATIRAAGEVYYPLFFCKGTTPTSEPSCVPSRPESVKGSSVYTGAVTADDKDGDGIPDDEGQLPDDLQPDPSDGQRPAGGRRPRRHRRRLRHLPRGQRRRSARARRAATSTATASPTGATTAPRSRTRARPTPTRTARATRATRARPRTPAPRRARSPSRRSATRQRRGIRTAARS